MTTTEASDGRMSIAGHLRDLQICVRNSVIWLTIGFAIAFTFKEQIYAFLAAPLIETWIGMMNQEGSVLGAPELYFKSVIEPFWTYFSVALWAGVFIASPFIFYQLWKFIAPGLLKKESDHGVAFAVMSAVLFIGGAAFCYYALLPIVFEFFLSYATENMAKMALPFGGGDVSMGQQVALKPQLFMQEYLALTRKMLLGFGVVFELPLVVFFLAMLGVVSHRGLWKFNRWMVVLSLVISAILTPPDIYSQLLMAGPLLVMYNLSIILAWIVTVRRERRERRALEREQDDLDDST